MDINIQFVQTKTNNDAENLALEKLERLAKKYDWLIRAEVFFKEEKDSNGKGKICDMRLSCPGPRIFASSNEENFEAAVTETISDLEKQVIKRKSELTDHL